MFVNILHQVLFGMGVGSGRVGEVWPYNNFTFSIEIETKL